MARAAGERIVAEALAAYDPATLWPLHPRDLDAGDAARARGFTSLYLGAAGTAWALRRLTGGSPIGADALLDAFDAEPDMPSMRYGLLLGDVGVSLVALELGGAAAHAGRLEAAIRDATPRAERELLWAAPGAIHAALAAHEHTGDDRWLACARAAVDELWRTLDPPDERGLRAVDAGSLRPPAAAARPRARVRRQRPCAAARRGPARAGAACRADRDRGAAPGRDRGLGRRGRELARGARRRRAAAAPADLPRRARGPRRPRRRSRRGRTRGSTSCCSPAGEATWRAGPIARGPGLCHGTAGNGYALLALWERTGDERWLERARAFAMHALGQCERERAAVGHGRHALWTGDLILPFFVEACTSGTAAVAGLEQL